MRVSMQIPLYANDIDATVSTEAATGETTSQRIMHCCEIKRVRNAPPELNLFRLKRAENPRVYNFHVINGSGKQANDT